RRLTQCRVYDCQPSTRSEADGFECLTACSKTSCLPRQRAPPTRFPPKSARIVGPVPSAGGSYKGLRTSAPARRWWNPDAPTGEGWGEEDTFIEWPCPHSSLTGRGRKFLVVLSTNSSA